MATPAATTVAEYLAALPADKRKVISKVRSVIRANLPKGYAESFLFGMISYGIPLSRYPDTYNGQPLGVAALASTKSGYSLYLMCTYMDPKLDKWFKAGFAKAGKKLDMGKACVRFKALDDLPLELVGQVIAKVSVDEYIARYEAVKKK